MSPRLRITDRPIAWLAGLVRAGRQFVLAGYSDAEWFSMLGLRDGARTGLGQILHAGHGRRLVDVLRRRQSDPGWVVAVPRCLTRIPALTIPVIEEFLEREGIVLDATERDQLTDLAAETAQLRPLVRALAVRPLLTVGPPELARLDLFAPGLWRHVPIAGPNLHLETHGIERSAEAILRAAHDHPAARRGEGLPPGLVVTISAGLSSAVLQDLLWDARPRLPTLLNVGSIWDAFVGIGRQRAWREKLFNDHAAYLRWLEENR